MTFRVVRLPDSRLWLRVADPEWEDPLDPTYAGRYGGRWNPPNSYPTLYLNADVDTARRQLEQLLDGEPIRVEDLRDDAYALVAATLPRNQDACDAVTDAGLKALGLPTTYPADANGERIPHADCQPMGQTVREEGLRGVWCRSAVRLDGSGRELAWFPAELDSDRAREHWDDPLPLGDWRDATGWEDLGASPQPDPAPADGQPSPADP